MLRQLICKSVLVVVLSVTAFAGSGQQEKRDRILLKEGKALTGTLHSDDGTTIRFTERKVGKIVTYAYNELHPRTVYRLMKTRTSKTDASGQLRVAAYALDHELFDQARRHYRLALKADAKLGNKIEGDLQALRQRAGVKVLNWSRKHMDSGDVLKAERYLGLLLEKYPNTEVATEASLLLEQLAVRAMAAREKKTEERAAAKSARAESAAKKKLEAGKKHYFKAHKLNLKGLQSTKSHSQAKNYFSQSIREFTKARAVLTKVSKDVDPDSPLGALIKSYFKTLTEETVEVQLHLASEYFYRGSLKNAREVTLEARALDPKNREVKRMLARLELAANDDNRSGRRRGRR
ncbi:MAG: tetratricopeptide (TPR) repeat protein [Planctomycetota bacterium]|jgi:tetratricopeptide (TPR) repeat protein